MIGTTELIIIVGVVVLLFGAKKIPELARSLGASLREFRQAKNELEEPAREVKAAVSDASKVIQEPLVRHPGKRA